MKILVTGAAGFIGSWVAQRLLERGDVVVGLDNFDAFYDRAQKERNLQHLMAHKTFSFLEGDILDRAAWDKTFSDQGSAPIQGVVHLAALAGVRPSLQRPDRYMRVNIEGTATLLQACQQAHITRLVVASSSSVYGVRSASPFREDEAANVPASPYAASKRATELICSTFVSLYPLHITCLRYFTVYGPRQRPEMAIHKFVRQALSGESLTVFGDGSSGRDYTYIDDAVAGTIAAFDRSMSPGFHVYNIGGTHPVSLQALVAAIGQATGKAIAIDRQPNQAGDVPHTCADISAAARDLGYAPKVPLTQGLEQFVAWYNAE